MPAALRVARLRLARGRERLPGHHRASHRRAAQDAQGRRGPARIVLQRLLRVAARALAIVGGEPQLAETASGCRARLAVSSSLRAAHRDPARPEASDSSSSKRRRLGHAARGARLGVARRQRRRRRPRHPPPRRRDHRRGGVLQLLDAPELVDGAARLAGAIQLERDGRVQRVRLAVARCPELPPAGSRPARPPAGARTPSPPAWRAGASWPSPPAAAYAVDFEGLAASRLRLGALLGGHHRERGRCRRARVAGLSVAGWVLRARGQQARRPAAG